MFEDATRAGLISRIEALRGSETPQWGKMNVSQMVEHCIRWEQITNGQIKSPRVFLGYLFGKMALKSMTADDKPVKQGMPTLKELVVTDTPAEFEAQKQKWIALLNDYKTNTTEYFMHPFCGKMTRDQTGILSYKHTDHHLQQFGR